MTVFELIVVSCLSVSSLASAGCDSWHNHGALFKTFESCQEAGNLQVGQQVFSTVNEDRRVVSFTCQPRGVHE